MPGVRPAGGRNRLLRRGLPPEGFRPGKGAPVTDPVALLKAELGVALVASALFWNPRAAAHVVRLLRRLKAKGVEDAEIDETLGIVVKTLREPA